ncbi:hypothetical protein G6F56_000860 [Rhizopus delemar]|nr:hypothetical protein G6F56_000860 [Rhizopus delemar]
MPNNYNKKRKSVEDHQNTRPFKGFFDDSDVEKENVEYSTEEEEIYPPFIERYVAPYTSIQYFGKNGEVTSIERIYRNGERTIVDYETKGEDKTPEEAVDYGDEEYGNDDYLENVAEADVEEAIVCSNNKKKQNKLFCAWRNVMPELVKAYISFLGSSPRDPVTCACPSSEIRFKKLNLFSWDVVQEEQAFEYCGRCSTLPVALVKAGMFPLSPENPLGAVHFALCEVLLRSRNVYAASGEKIAEFMSLQHSNSKKHLSAENCSNTIILFNKMVELAESEVMDMENVSSSNPEDKQFLMANGNFHLKGRKPLKESLVLDFVPGSKKFDDL